MNTDLGTQISCKDGCMWCRQSVFHYYYYYYYNRFTALWILSRTTRVSQFQKGKTKTNLDFAGARDSDWQWYQLGQCKSAPRPRQITTLALHHSVFYRLDAFPAAQPTASKHWRHLYFTYLVILVYYFTTCNRQELCGFSTSRLLSRLIVIMYLGI